MVETLTFILLPAYAIMMFFTIVIILRLIEGGWNDEKKTKPKKVPFITITIPAYNEEDTIKKTTESALKLDYPKNKYEIIIVNDGSTDNTEQEAKKIIKENLGRNITIINQKNQGKAIALNNALSRAKGEYFACLDADSYAHEKALKEHVKTFQTREKNTAAITPIMLVHKPKKFIEWLQHIEYILSAFFQHMFASMDSLFVTPGPFSIYKTEIIKKVGGFTKETVTEDQEMAFRLQKEGYKLAQCQHAYVYTTAPKTWKELYRQRRRWLYGGIQCLTKYNNLILNKKAGDFGIFQLPMNAAFYILSIITLTVFFYLQTKTLSLWWRMLNASGFDIITIIKTLTFKINIFTINIVTIILFIITLTFIIIFYILAHAHTREKYTMKEIIIFIPFILFYYLFPAFITLSLIPKLIKREKYWW